MNTLKFQTDICCENCIRYLAHFFSDAQIKRWKIDLKSKILIVEQENLKAQVVIDIVKKAGYTIEQMKSQYQYEAICSN